MRKRALVILALATLVTLASTAFTATSRAQDAERTVNLSPGCNMITLTFADGTEAATVADAVTPSDALESVWHLDNATGTFQGFSPQFSEASQLASLQLLDAVFLCVGAAAEISMPGVSPDPSGAPITASLSSGCNAVGLTFADGSAPSEVAAAVTPADALESVWRLDNVSGAFQGFSPQFPEASQLTSLQFLDAVYVCSGGPASLEMPAVTEPGPEAVTGPPRDVRYVMEGAVPQVVDLSSDFVAIGEDFWSYDPPDPLYYYSIAYGSIFGLIGAPMETLIYLQFDLGLFATVGDAKSVISEFRAMSADEFKAQLDPIFGGSLGLEIGSLTFQEVEPPAGLGEEASFRRIRTQVRPVHSNEIFIPEAIDVVVIRRDRVIGWIFAGWSPGPPGPEFKTENLAKKMDAGIQTALPELLAAVP